MEGPHTAAATPPPPPKSVSFEGEEQRPGGSWWERALFPPVTYNSHGTEFEEYALGCLHLLHPVRQAVIQFIMWPAFDNAVLFIILLNCVFMAINSDTLERDTELLFLSVFTIEMGLKVVAHGFAYERDGYLRSAWNWLDFVVVVTGWMTVCVQAAAGSSGLEAVSAVRAVRVLRPLRTINRVPGMKVLVRSLLDAVPAMANVMLLCSFIFLVFGIIGAPLLPLLPCSR